MTNLNSNLLENLSIDANDAVVLLADFPEKNLYKGFVCNFEFQDRDTNGEVLYIVSYLLRDENIMESVSSSACLKLIYPRKQDIDYYNNKTLVLLSDFPEKKLYKGYICNFIEPEHEELDYLVSYVTSKPENQIFHSVPSSSCLKLIYENDL